MSEKNIREYFVTWSKGKNDRIEDYLWFIFQDLLIETGKQSKTELQLLDYHHDIYLEMAVFRRKHEDQKANEIWQLMNDVDLRRALVSTNFLIQAIFISGHCCEYCNSFNEKKFSINDALTHKYWDISQCTREFGCNCCYGILPFRDEDGNLIMNDR